MYNYIEQFQEIDIVLFLLSVHAWQDVHDHDTVQVSGTVLQVTERP